MNVLFRKFLAITIAFGLAGHVILFAGWLSGHAGQPWWRGQLIQGAGGIFTLSMLGLLWWWTNVRIKRMLRKDQQRFRKAHDEVQMEVPADDDNR